MKFRCSHDDGKFEIVLNEKSAPRFVVCRMTENARLKRTSFNGHIKKVNRKYCLVYIFLLESNETTLNIIIEATISFYQIYTDFDSRGLSRF